MASRGFSKQRKQQVVKPLKFSDKLVLNQWALSLFEVDSFNKLADRIKDPVYEGVDENNISNFFHVLTAQLFERKELSKDILRYYDENIVRHTQHISQRRKELIKWKYFQYLSLLFTEIYLDKYFRDANRLLSDLNEFIDNFNEGKPNTDQIQPYELNNLNKIAFWSATGSGKTLLMHINILQYKHYLKLHNRERELNRIILLTPNEGLSKQHLEEFRLSNIEADLFSKDTTSLFKGAAIEIIDIHKLREEAGEKTVAIDAFEGNNLVMVDEGHRGASGLEWKARRDQLCENGFSFEYSATFGQAMKASGNKKMEQEYAKCILFDYSYKYFYRDGFGKDYRILNLSDDSDDEVRRIYLTACLLSFYQQKRLYKEKSPDFAQFLIEEPLWIFVGSSVNAVRQKGGRQVSDVIDILLFIADFIKNRERSVSILERLLSGSPGVLDIRGREIFANAFHYLIKLKIKPDELFEDIIKVVFNSSAQASLHIENLKDVEGEIALKLGNNEPFGVINVGDSNKLCKLCEDHGEFDVTETKFSSSLFERIDSRGSNINILIGSKKFTEGWNSWRVSTMGLMNVGQTEGSEIIQLFGRGVRLKGYNFTLKRSNHVSGVQPPKNINILETLNIFGIRADYMKQFKEYLEEEGIPSNEDRIEIVIPTIKNLGTEKLKVVDVEEGLDYKKNGTKPCLDRAEDLIKRNAVELNWYPKIQAQESKGISPSQESELNKGWLEKKHLAFMDIDSLFFELERFKNERAWYNLNLNQKKIMELLESQDWYTLYIPPLELEFDSFSKVRRWQELAEALLKKYCDRYYKYRKAEWESDHLEYREITPSDSNIIAQYTILVNESEESLVHKINELKEAISRKKLIDIEYGYFHAIMFEQHLYQPLIYMNYELIEIIPVSLNEGEKKFVIDLRDFYRNKRGFFADKQLYLLRNQSRGKGLGFFEAGNFYPDFILWILNGNRQYVSFVDPKGIRMLEGEQDPKINFYKTIKNIESKLNDPDIKLNSFIISNTEYTQVKFWGMSREELEGRNVLFQDVSNYMERLIERTLNQ